MAPKRLLILGTGWGGTSLLRALRNHIKYDITIVSTRDHMLFTPLLASTATGALEHRSIIEPIRPIATQKQATFLNARATSIRASDSVVDLNVVSASNNVVKFEQPYDILVVGVGATVNTFGIKGVNEHAMFMKEASHARAVRKRMHDLFEMAALPITSPHEKQALLTFVCVGAGPTGVELTAEISDWLKDMALSRRYNRELVDLARVVLVEASGDILSTFDHSLRSYALRRLRAGRVQVKLGSMVSKVEKNSVTLIDSSNAKGKEQREELLNCGMVVWTAGVAPRQVIQECDQLKRNSRNSHLLTDDFLMCDPTSDNHKGLVFAIGDCAEIDSNPLVPIAQVAEQQGIYLSNVLNNLDTHANEFSKDMVRQATGDRPFSFTSKGMLAYVGSFRGVASVKTGVQKVNDEQSGVMNWSGFTAWLTWRYAYFSKLGSLRNKLQVPLDWMKTALFGRDVSSF